MSPWRPTAALLIHLYPFEASFQTLDWPSVFHWDFGRTTAWLPFYLSCSETLLSECALLVYSCLHLLHLTSKLSCEYIQSTHLACWFGQMLTKAISWMMSSIASATPRGVPVSPLRSWNWSLVLYTLPLPTIKALEPHPGARWAVRFRSPVTHFTVTYPPPLLLRVSSYATILLVSYPPLCIISACL